MTQSLRNGGTQSCGCWRKQRNAAACTKHGATGTRLYRVWAGMKNRCCTLADKTHRLYGARGIRVCDEWSASFEAFALWAESNGYRDDLTIDRINNDGDYAPDNCRWATRSQQNSNRRPYRIKKREAPIE